MARCDRRTHNARVQSPRSANEEVEQPVAESANAITADDVRAVAHAAGASKDVVAPARCASRSFEFAGDLGSVAESREQVMQFVCEHCSDDGERIDILVALQEALANAALHGCGDDPAKRIQCNVVANASDIAITVRDFGPGFDLALADPEKYDSSTLSHGRGICLVRSVMTEVSFARGGSEIKMRKHISSCSP